MKDSKKYHIIVLATLVSFALLGCSSVKPTQGPSVRDLVAPIINADSPAEEPATASVEEPSSAPAEKPERVSAEEPSSAPLKELSLAPVEVPLSLPSDRPVRHWSAPLKSVPTVRSNVKDPAVQRVQGHLLWASDIRGVESARQWRLSQLFTISLGKPKAAPQKRRTVSARDGLTRVLNADNTTKKPAVISTVPRVIAATETAEDKNPDEEPSTKDR